MNSSENLGPNSFNKDGKLDIRYKKIGINIMLPSGKR